ncbi:endothelial cell-specific chemotaxis regulator [Podargus strigoides]
MLAPSIPPLLWLFGCVLFRGTTASTHSSIHAVTALIGYNGPFSGLSSNPPYADPANKKHIAFSKINTTNQLDSHLCGSNYYSQILFHHYNGVSVDCPSFHLDVENSTKSVWWEGFSPSTSKPVSPTPKSSGYLPAPTPTDDKSPLTVAAFGVISFIVILIVVVIILVSVVSLRFKCNRSKDSEDKQKPGTSMVSESCSAGTSQKDNSITLISMKNINMNNSMGYPLSEKTQFYLSVKRSGHKRNAELLQLLKSGRLSLLEELPSPVPLLSQSILIDQKSRCSFQFSQGIRLLAAPRTTSAPPSCHDNKNSPLGSTVQQLTLGDSWFTT